MRIVPKRWPLRPWRWAENQLAHMMLGLMAATLVCYAYLLAFEEFPVRHVVFAVLVLIYGLYVELTLQGWAGADTVEDTVFFAIYGSGPVLYAFREVEIGSGAFYGDITDLAFFALAIPAHLLTGIGARCWNRRRARHGGL